MANIIFSEGSGVANSVFGKSQEPIKAMIESGVEAFEEKSLISNIFMGVTAIISVVSGAVYMANGWKTINFKD